MFPLVVYFMHKINSVWAFPGGSAVKNPPANAGEVGLIPGWGETPWCRNWQTTPVFLPGESHGQRSLASYSPWLPQRIGHDLATKQQQKSMVYMCQSQPSNSSHPTPCFLGIHSFLCVSISALHVRSSVPFSLRFHIYVSIYGICFSLCWSKRFRVRRD